MSPANDNFKREPFQFTLRKRWEDGKLQLEESFNVPANMRLVIENISGMIECHIEQELHGVDVKTRVNSVDAWHSVYVPRIGTKDNLSIYSGGQQTRVYADPGTTVTVLVHRDVSSGSIGINMVFLSGYLLSDQSPTPAP